MHFAAFTGHHNVVIGGFCFQSANTNGAGESTRGQACVVGGANSIGNKLMAVSCKLSFCCKVLRKGSIAELMSMW